jgi:hypothetical protein
MNKSSGATTIALILAAVVGLNYIPRSTRDSGSESAKPSQTQGKPTGSRSEVAKSEVSEPCSDIGGLLKRFFPQGVPYPEQCYPPGKAPHPAPPGADMKVVVALVPDPIQTHLPLFFDRAIEAIQQAAQDEGYSYDRSWFPWSDEHRQYTHLIDDLANRDRDDQIEKQPGVMVFRQGLGDQDHPLKPYTGGLVVLVVGEQPTRGITDSQFENAMQWFASLDPSGKQPLRVLGPTTSGALPSLERGLSATKQYWSHRSGLQIFSGTVSSPTGFHWFCKTIQQSLAIPISSLDAPCVGRGGQSAISLDFRTYNESDALLTERLCAYLKREGYDLGRLAFLSEDETAFGGVPEVSEEENLRHPKGTRVPEDSREAPIYLYYPRDIAALRAAYEQQSIFATGKQSANAPSTTLRGDLTEPASSKHDTVRTYGGQLDPLAQESILLGIVEKLRNKNIQFVLIRSSNTLDEVFLSEFLRRTYPEGRIVLDGADVLFLRSGQGVSLRGVMALSTYPLLTQQQGWTRSLRAHHSGSYRVFGQDSAESIYLATRGLLTTSEGTQDVPVHDSLPPLWAPVVSSVDRQSEDSARPTTWLTVIGHRSFWPVAALSEVTKMHSEEQSILRPASQEALAAGDDPAPDDASPGAHLVFPLQMKVLLIICTVLGIVHLGCCWFGSVEGPLRALNFFAPLPYPQHRQLIFLGSLMVGLLGAVLAVVGGLTSGTELTTRVWWVMWLTTVLLIGCSVVSLVGNYGLPPLRGCGDSGKEPAKCQSLWIGLFVRIRQRSRLIVSTVVAQGVLVFGYFALLHYYLIGDLFAANRFPTFWRAVNLFSGVSPLLPQVLMLAGLYAWFWCNLNGMALLGEDRPQLPTEAAFKGPERLNGSSAAAKQTRPVMRILSREQMQEPVECDATPLARPWLKIFPVCLVGAALILRIALRGWGLRSLGEMRFGYVMFWWLVVIMALLLTDTVQLLRTWRGLRNLLVLLDRLRLRRTLAAMKGIAWGSVWKMSGNVLEERYRVLSRQFECLRNLDNALRKWKPKPKERTAKAAALRRLRTCLVSGRRFAEWYVTLSDDEKLPPFHDWYASLTEPRKNKVSAFPEWCWKRLDRKLICAVAPMACFQDELADTAAVIMNRILVPEWMKESHSLLVDKSRLQEHQAPPTDAGHPFTPSSEISDMLRAAEEFFILPYLGFIQNTLGRIRTMVLGLLSLFVGMTLAVSIYPFDPLPVLGGVFLSLFVVVGATVVVVYAGMFRDATLSYVTNTNPGELGLQFWTQLAAFGLGPLFALLTTLFPSMTDFLASWVQPSAQALK